MLGLIVLAGCGSNSNLVSSFGQRKYTKGHFNNGTGAIPTVIASHKPNEGNYTRLSEYSIQRDNEFVTPKHSLRYISEKAVKAKVVCNSKPSIAVNMHVNTIDHIPADSAKTQPVKKIDTDERTVGESLIIPGAVIFIFSLFFGIRGISPWLMLAIGLALLVFGLLYYFDAANKGTPEPAITEDDKSKPKQSSQGWLGFRVEIIGIAAMIIFALLFNSIAFGSAVFATSVSIIDILVVLSGLTAIIGFALCIISLLEHEKTNGFALAGIIIGLLTLAYLLFVH